MTLLASLAGGVSSSPFCTCLASNSPPDVWNHFAGTAVERELQKLGVGVAKPSQERSGLDDGRVLFVQQPRSLHQAHLVRHGNNYIKSRK